MKKILILLGTITLSINIFAADGCGMSLVPMSATTSPIELWGMQYEPCHVYEWNVVFPDEWRFVEFHYTIDMNPAGAIDAVMIYLENEEGEEDDIINYPYRPITGSITIPLHSRTARIVCVSEYGNANGLYRGFKLHYHQGNALPSNQVFFTNVGIGTYPQETLHVNGAIRGGGTQGEITFSGKKGFVTIGASDDQAMSFNTDKTKFVFNKPISGSGSYGALQIKSSTGNLELGPMDSGYTYFKTNMASFYFDKEVLLGTGFLSSPTTLTFRTNYTNCCMTILTNGNVGIATQSPNYKLDVNGIIRANEIIVNTTGADFVFEEDYQLRPLSEVKAFITENKHLPEIKSAQEMQENGVGVNELQIQLLQKIEELTLYILQQEDRIKALEAK